MQGVAVELKVREEVALPAASKFIIGSSGLLGNRFVDVLVDPDADLTKHLEPGAVVQGQRETGLEDLTRDSAVLMADLRKAVTTINTALERLDKTALSESSLEDLRATMANLKKGSEGFANINQTTKDLQAAAADARKLMSSARTGSGPLPMVLNDRQAANDLKALIGNLRKHGVLWYKDSQKSAP
jgi:phospholipid/cholesterol/gamma-HCH transport system substrate-binding protein